ncbi:MAG: hypothetical protein HYX49_01185 [Chloroflexi bacterium]|nr:hypothetical protein [Chloroflexota bacterium]
MRRFPWVSLAAILIGFALGLIYAWVVAPVRYIDTTPNTLRADFKDQFRIAIAASYASTRDLGRAKARLALLGDGDSNQALTAQAQRMLAAGEPFDVVQQVAQLAADLQRGVAQAPPSATTIATVSARTATQTAAAPGSSLEAPTATIDLTASETVSTVGIFDTPTPRPTRTPIPTAGAPYVLTKQDTVCNPNLTDGLMQITVVDKNNRQMPGVEIVITWSGGEEHFFTGLKPEIANGYADYIMQAGITYTVRIAGSGTPASDLTAPACTDSSGQTYTGGLHLIFQQP